MTSCNFVDKYQPGETYTYFCLQRRRDSILYGIVRQQIAQ